MSCGARPPRPPLRTRSYASARATSSSSLVPDGTCRRRAACRSPARRPDLLLDGQRRIGRRPLVPPETSVPSSSRAPPRSAAAWAARRHAVSVANFAAGSSGLDGSLVTSLHHGRDGRWKRNLRSMSSGHLRDRAVRLPCQACRGSPSSRGRSACSCATRQIRFETPPPSMPAACQSCPVGGPA